MASLQFWVIIFQMLRIGRTMLLMDTSILTYVSRIPPTWFRALYNTRSLTMVLFGPRTGIWDREAITSLWNPSVAFVMSDSEELRYLLTI